MTDTTDIKALREAALKATIGEWCTDSQHSVIADAGLNANYYVAACSGPDSKINAKFIALANPATIIALLDQLEAERQRAADLVLHVNTQANMREKSESEIAALKGEQVPMFLKQTGIGSNGCQGSYKEYVTIDESEYEENPVKHLKLFTAPQKPIVLLPPAYEKSADFTEYHQGWNACRNYMLAESKEVGGIVKDGE